MVALPVSHRFATESSLSKVPNGLAISPGCRDCESVDLGLPAKPTNRLVRRMQLSGDFLASPISRRPGQVVAA